MRSANLARVIMMSDCPLGRSHNDFNWDSYFFQ